MLVRDTEKDLETEVALCVRGILITFSIRFFIEKQPQTGVCKTRTGYLRMADAYGKMRIEKRAWEKKCG